MKTDIDPVRQPYCSVLCGPACASMVLSAYDIKRSQYAIARGLPMTKQGVRSSELGEYFLEQGFAATLFHWCRGLRPQLMGRTAYNAVLNGLEQPLTSMACRQDVKDRKADARRIRRFMEAGGQVRLEPVQSWHIRQALDHQWPPIVNVNPRILDGYGTRDAGHFVVPVAMTDEDPQTTRRTVTFYDPVSGREQTRDTDAFMHACHLWYGAALFPHPKGTVLDFV